MIPKQQILDLAQEERLQPSTVEKDYVLGWLLHAVASHERLSRWAFKGGTCLKKCFFETYRFSEDLDFTIPASEPFGEQSVLAGLAELADWIEGHVGLQFPRGSIEAKPYTNPRGNRSIQAKMTYVGPLKLPRQQLQRIKFDLTQDELIADVPQRRDVFHPYSDAPKPPLQVLCYSVDEVVAEKTRALYERQGRARDIYDLVHLSRNFRATIDAKNARRVVAEKFAFKRLPEPGVAVILDRIDQDGVRANWQAQLGHQLPVLPSADLFLAELHDAVEWWLEPAAATSELAPVTAKTDEEPVQMQAFPSFSWSSSPMAHARAPVWYGSSSMNDVVYAARNRLCVEVMYGGVRRLVEPYSLRRPKTGNLLLYVHEVRRGNAPGEGIKALKVSDIGSTAVSGESFTPRFAVEL